jgi:ribonuclease HI
MQPRASDVIKWTPPAEGRYKVNYDGAIFSTTNDAGLGVIIRNARGEVMGSLCQRVPFPHSVEAVEASAARCAIQFAKDLGIMEIDLEGDSKTVVDALLLSWSMHNHLWSPYRRYQMDSSGFMFCSF